jgi:LysR family transcriptional regulator, regulator for bpeEF and oprC
VFLERHPELRVSLDLSTRVVDLLADGVDVAVRLGPMPSSGLIATRLGAMTRHVCAAPAYLARRGIPRSLDELAEHDTVDMPGVDGRPRRWTFTNDRQTRELEITPRTSVNEALTLYKLVRRGAGIGIVSGYLCEPTIAARQLVRLFPEWSLPSVEVSVVFPSKRELDPNVREFVRFMKEVAAPGRSWLKEPVWSARSTTRRARSRREQV